MFLTRFQQLRSVYSLSSRVLTAQYTTQPEAVTLQDQKSETSTAEQNASNKQEAEPNAKPRNPQYDLQDSFAPYRFIYPEFLPDPDPKYRNRIREKLERIDMLRRREHLDIPEFYVGSILKTVVSDKYAIGKTNEFVGLCIERGGSGLNAWFTLRNVIDHQGVEIKFNMYAPIIQSIRVLVLEKRLDESLRYLRDCPLEYSTIPFDIQPVYHNPDDPVPINTIKVKLNPKPWTVKWNLKGLQGVEDLDEHIYDWERSKIKTWKFQTGVETVKYDLMKTYRSTIPAEEQTEIYSEIAHKLSSLTQTLRKQKKKRIFVKPEKSA